MSNGVEADPNKPVFEDDFIKVTLHNFRPQIGQATLIVRDKQARVGFYYIRVRFGSGNETRVDFNGNNPAQPRVLDFRTIE